MNNSIAPGTKVRFKIPGKRKHADGIVDTRKPTHYTHHTKIPVKGEYGDEFWCRPSTVEVISEKPNTVSSPSQLAVSFDKLSFREVEPPPPELPSYQEEQPDNNSSTALTDSTALTEIQTNVDLVLLQADLRSINPRLLTPHPQNLSIYGENEDVSQLVELILESGWIKPIVVTPEGRIISGHRRWKASLQLGWDEVPIIVQEFSDEVAQLEALLLENASRNKNPEQKVREGFTWEIVEREKARQRQQKSAIALNQSLGRETKVENFPHSTGGKGKTRDAIANRVGLGSGRNYDKAAKVVQAIDELIGSSEEENRDFAYSLRQALNLGSVHAAYKLLHPNTGRKPKTVSTYIGENTVEPENFPSERQRVIVSNPNSPFFNQHGMVTARPNRDLAIVLIDVNAVGDIGVREPFAVSELQPEPLPGTPPIEHSNEIPPSLSQCWTKEDVFGFIFLNAESARDEFLQIEWSDRNAVREISLNTIDLMLIGKLKELGLDYSPIMGLLERDKVAEIEYLKRENLALKSLTQVKIENQSDEWLEETIKQCQQELNRRHSDSARHLRVLQGKLSL